MNYLTKVSFIASLSAALAYAVPFYAIDFHTDPVYVPLKNAISQTQSIEEIQGIWTSVCNSANLSQLGTTTLAHHAEQYALEIKQKLEQELAALGTASYPLSALVKGTAKIVVGLWGLMLPVMQIAPKDLFHSDIQLLGVIDIFFTQALITNNPYVRNTVGKVSDGLRATITRIVTTWILYAGINQVKTALNYKATRVKQIDNLNQTITFLQSIQQV